METSRELAARLLTALDELVEQEGMYLRGGFYDLSAAARQRAEPLVQELVALAGDAALAAEFRARVATVLARSAEHAAIMQDKLTEFSAELRRVDQARHRVARVAPAYVASPRAAVPRFQAAG